MLEILQTGIPRIKRHTRRSQATRFGRANHSATVVVFGVVSSVGIGVDIINAKVQRHNRAAVVAVVAAVALSPNQRQKIDAANHTSMLAAPMARNQIYLLRIGLVQRGVVENQQTAFGHGATRAAQDSLRFDPQRLWIKRSSCQQARVGVMSGVFQAVGLALSGLDTTKGGLSRQQKLDVVTFCAAARVHALWLTPTT